MSGATDVAAILAARPGSGAGKYRRSPMLGTMRGTKVPAMNRLFALVLASIAAAPVAARADDGLVDVRTLPRLEGAVENPARTEPHSLSFGVPTAVAVTIPEIE